MPAKQADAEGRRAAGSTVDVELAAQQADALADAHEPKPAVLRGADHRRLDLEALAVVLDLNPDLALPAVDRDADRCRVAMVADVGETLLHDSVDGDPLRRRQALELAAQLERDACRAARFELVDLAPKNFGASG